MRKVYLASAALLLMAAGAISAQEVQVGSGDDAAAQEKKICRSQRMTGSLTRTTRICLTKAQWDELNTRTRKSVDDISRGGSRPDAVQMVNPQTGF